VLIVIKRGCTNRNTVQAYNPDLAPARTRALEKSEEREGKKQQAAEQLRICDKKIAVRTHRFDCQLGSQLTVG
jgi:hypothetical protein